MPSLFEENFGGSEEGSFLVECRDLPNELEDFLVSVVVAFVRRIASISYQYLLEPELLSWALPKAFM